MTVPEHLWILPILFVTGLTAGLIDSIAGGGGLITIPVLLGIGIPPHLALGTNKFQSSFGSFTASHHYVRKGVVDLHDARPGILWTLLGAAAGAWLVQRVQITLLSALIPVLLLIVAAYSMLTPRLGEHARQPVLSRSAFYCSAGLCLGFYDGFFGPGVGSFWAIVFVTGLGFTLTRATGYTKVMNFTSNIVSMILFLLGGNVLFLEGGVMALGQIAGARIGSGLVVRRGATFIRPVYISVVIATTGKLLYDRFFP